jgi:hypothetical protein
VLRIAAGDCDDIDLQMIDLSLHYIKSKIKRGPPRGRRVEVVVVFSDDPNWMPIQSVSDRLLTDALIHQDAMLFKY